MSNLDLTPCTNPKHPDCNIAHDRLKLEATMIRGLIRGLKTEGFRPIAVFTDEQEDVKTEKATLDAVFSVDESTITFEKNGRRHGVLVVLGNGIDCICDHDFTEGDPDGFLAAMDRITDELYKTHDA